MPRAAFAIVLAGLAVSGCVIVNPADVHLSASPAPLVIDSPRPSIPQNPYGKALHRVLGQPEKISKDLSDGDWEEVLDETNDWLQYTRELSGLADTSANPARFRRGCDELLVQIQHLRDAAVRHDAAGCRLALRGCDPILNQFSRDFPVARAVQPPPTPPRRVP